MAYKDPDYTNYGLDKFVSIIKGAGLAHTNQYSVLFYLPTNLQYGKKDPAVDSKSALQRLSLLCDSVTIPGLNLITNEVAVYGESRQMPTQRLFSDVSLSFYVDAEMNVKRLFDKWMDIIIDPVSRTLNYYDDYISNVEIYVHDRNFNVVYQVVLFECYPKTIQQIGLDYSLKEPMKLQVSLQYKYYKIEEIRMEAEALQNFLATNNIQYDNSSNPNFNFKINPIQ